MGMKPSYREGELDSLKKRGEIFDEKYFSNDENWYKDYMENQADVYRGMDTRILNLIGAKQGQAHIDVGCSFGYLVKMLKDKGMDAYGIDISEFAVNHSYSENVFFGSVLHIPFEDNSFDVVWCLGTLMYFNLPDVYRAVNELCRVSKKYVVLATLTKTCTQSDQRVNKDEYRKSVLPSWQDYNGLFLKNRMKNICNRPWRYHYEWNAVYEKF